MSGSAARCLGCLRRFRVLQAPGLPGALKASRPPSRHELPCGVLVAGGRKFLARVFIAQDIGDLGDYLPIILRPIGSDQKHKFGDAHFTHLPSRRQSEKDARFHIKIS